MNQKELYETLWRTEYTPSACALPLADFIAQDAKREDTLLDIGCGDGTTVMALRNRGFNAFGFDLTLEGVIRNHRLEPNDLQYFIEASVCDLREIPDNKFDYTFSTDVLEHLPEIEVDIAIAEILRITKRKTFHSMPSWGDDRLGMDVHLTKREPDWWINKFLQLNHKGVEVLIKGREQFLREMKYGN